ncbi:MHS family MFS transporter [Nonomuraea sp. NBC_01738]|uniref:MFS transporter n=1 Tax=Nonomuraea sp. NBC_01738 TaxID=2976003 RepID=UPI002E0F49EA|nr:MHS family MFS transporter [Nonomuraea sp. NBC_01738]
MKGRRTALAGAVGSIVEYYDFTLFGLAAALVFNEQFFPDSSPGAATLSSFATFAVGFFARPVGGAVFSHFGDRIGRKPMMVITLLLMGLSTTAIGLLPSYASVGILAPILLVLLRLLQGFGAGAEYVGALVMVAEASDSRRRGLWASLPGTGVFTGILIATLVFAGASALPSFETWGWRLPFLLSIVAVGVGLFFRARVEESEVFERQKSEGTSRFPMLEVIRKQPKNLLIAFVANGPFVAISYLIQVFVLSYVTKTLELSKTTGLLANVVASSLAIVSTPLFGMLSDKVGRRPVWLGGAAFLVVFAFPMFWLVETGNTLLVIVSVTLGLAVGIASMYAAQASLYTELFETRFRFSGIALARESTSALIGGPAPFVAAALLEASGGASWPIALLVLGFAAISFVAILFAPETRQADLSVV